MSHVSLRGIQFKNRVFYSLNYYYCRRRRWIQLKTRVRATLHFVRFIMILRTKERQREEKGKTLTFPIRSSLHVNWKQQSEREKTIYFVSDGSSTLKRICVRLGIDSHFVGHLIGWRAFNTYFINIPLLWLIEQSRSRLTTPGSAFGALTLSVPIQ